MSSVKYHGEYPAEQVDGEGKPFVVQHGYIFTQGESVKVTDEGLLAKFAGNRFFEVSGKSDKDAIEQGKDDAERAETETLKTWLTDHQVPFHHKAGLKTLQRLKDDYLKAKAAASE